MDGVSSSILGPGDVTLVGLLLGRGGSVVLGENQSPGSST
jgi:hypothetical protein